MRTARDIVDVGYWTTGVQLPAVEARGSAYVIVDRSVSADLTARLARFERDLIGDGWRVQRLEVPRGDDTAPPVQTLAVMVQIRNWLKERYFQDPFGKHAVILVGHVPIPLSGKAAPDGHGAVPLPSDLFYADMDGTWRATPEGLLAETAVPGDFIEMQIGRIDFAPVSGGARDPRNRPDQSLLRQEPPLAHGVSGRSRKCLWSEQPPLCRTICAARISSAPRLWSPEGITTPESADPGSGAWISVRLMASDMRRIFPTRRFSPSTSAATSTRFHRPFNGMAALLAQPWYPLAVGWGGRPSWRLHHMALGGTIGDVHMRTVNNGRAADPYRETMDYFPTGNYLWRNPVWVNLLGDPTLRAFMLAPASRVVAHARGRGMGVSWLASPDPDTLVYRLYRAGRRPGFPADRRRRRGDGPVFRTPLPPEGAVTWSGPMRSRMSMRARSTLCRRAPSAPPGPRSVPAADLTLRTAMDQPVALPEVFSAVPPDGRIHALVEGPRTGRARSQRGRLAVPTAPGLRRDRHSALHGLRCVADGDRRAAHRRGGLTGAARRGQVAGTRRAL